MPGLRLHTYFRSSTSFRVRIALNLKGLDYESIAWHLLKGEQKSEAYRAVNPQGLLPALEFEDGSVLAQSLAIMEWLDETYPEPALLPKGPMERARVRAMAYSIACDVHPVNNSRILMTLRNQYGADEAAVAQWFRTWVIASFEPLEHQLASESQTGLFCHGDTPGLADICLVAQVINNRRFDVDMAPYPTIQAISDRCMAMPEFEKAAPVNQPDAEG